VHGRRRDGQLQKSYVTIRVWCKSIPCGTGGWSPLVGTSWRCMSTSDILCTAASCTVVRYYFVSPTRSGSVVSLSINRYGWGRCPILASCCVALVAGDDDRMMIDAWLIHSRVLPKNQQEGHHQFRSITVLRLDWRSSPWLVIAARVVMSVESSCWWAFARGTRPTAASCRAMDRSSITQSGRVGLANQGARIYMPLESNDYVYL